MLHNISPQVSVPYVTSVYSPDSGVFGSAGVQLIWARLDWEVLLQAMGQLGLAPVCRLGSDLLSKCSGMEAEGAAPIPGMFFSRQIPGVQRGKPEHARLESCMSANVPWTKASHRTKPRFKG